MTRRQIGRILIVTGFSLLGELALRGPATLVELPALMPVITLIYLALFALLEDLIVRYRLQDYGLFLAALFFSFLFQLIFPQGGAFLPGAWGLLQINWAVFALINLMMWSSLQAVLAFYLGNRLLPRRWDAARLLPNWARLICLGVYCGGTALFTVAVLSFFGFYVFAPLGFLVYLVLLYLSGRSFFALLPRQRERTLVFRAVRWLDVVSAATVLALLYSLTLASSGDTTQVHAHLFNPAALRVVLTTSALASLTVWGYRVLRRRSIYV